MAFNDIHIFIELLCRGLAAFHDIILTKADVDQLHILFNELGKNHSAFEADLSQVVRNESVGGRQSGTACNQEMLRVLCHAIAIAGRAFEDTAAMLLRTVATVIQNCCEVSTIDSVLTTLNSFEVRNYMVSFLLGNVSKVGSVNTVIRIYQNVLSFLLTQMEPSEQSSAQKTCLIIPISLVEVFSKVMRSTNLMELDAASREQIDMDEACSMWNGIMRVLSTAVDYYRSLVDADVRELESFRGADLGPFEDARARAEKLLALLDHIDEEIVHKFANQLQSVIVLDESDSVVGMIVQMKAYSARIQDHFDPTLKSCLTQKALKDRICHAVATNFNIYW